jgi:hypothetical protein
LLNKIVISVSDLDVGRKGLSTDGEEHEGRIFYEKGINGSAVNLGYSLSF